MATDGFYPLRPMQRWLLETHLNKPDSTMMNISVLFKFDEKFDFARAIQDTTAALNAHDIFRARLVRHPETGEFCQRFDGEIVPLFIEKISDAEFEQRKKNLIRPYEIINQPLYRLEFFVTPTAKYVFFDCYHVVLDGIAAMILFWKEVEMRYCGKKILRQPLKYSDYILEELKIPPEELAEGNKFWREMLKGFDETRHLPPPDVEDSQRWQQNTMIIYLENISHEFFAQTEYSENTFFVAATMLAIARTTGARNSVMSWVHNGRHTAQERRLIGIMIEQFPISWDFEQDLSAGDFLRGLEAKIQAGMQYRRSLGTIYAEGLEDDCATLIFHKKEIGAFNETSFAGLPVEIVDLPPSKFAAAENFLDLELNLSNDGKYFIYFDYDASRYSETAMENFAAALDEIASALQDDTRAISAILNPKG